MVDKYSTDDASPIKFRPHGRVEFEVIDESQHLIWVRCYGPFNSELMSAVEEVQNNLTLLHPKRKEIIQFLTSCLGLPEFINAARDYAIKHKEMGIAPFAVALVIGDDVEGKALMLDDYRSIWEGANITLGVFDDVESAKHWLYQLP